MNESTRIRFARLAASLVVLSVAGGASADICDDQTGAAYGLCHAFFEANHCDQPAANQSACDSIADKYEEITQQSIEALIVCPCAAYLPSGWFWRNQIGQASEQICPDGTTVSPDNTLTYFNGAAPDGFPESLTSSRYQECGEEPTFTCSVKNTSAGNFSASISETEFHACRAVTSIP